MSRYPLLEKRIAALEKRKCCSIKSKITLTDDGSAHVSAGVEVDLIKIKSDSPLAALIIGTTEGGNDILTSTVTISGWNTYIVDAFSESDYKLYFGGITSSTNIIIYKR